MNRRLKALSLFAAAALTAGWWIARSAEGHDRSDLSLRSLRGEYIFALDGFTTAGPQPRPFAWAGREIYDGAGHVRGVYTASLDGVITRRAYTGTYTVHPDGTGATVLTDDHGEVTHFDIFISEDADEISYVETDAGVVTAGYERRSRR